MESSVLAMKSTTGTSAYRGLAVHYTAWEFGLGEQDILSAL